MEHDLNSEFNNIQMKLKKEQTAKAKWGLISAMNRALYHKHLIYYDLIHASLISKPASYTEC